jgi:2-oxoisovalerate ferredoxin oxidoreductase beta subunit
MAGKILEKSPAFYEQYSRAGHVDKRSTHYCPGCGHGVVHKLIAEALDDGGLTDKAVFISPVGCSVFAYYYFDTGNIQAAHGRAPAVATGFKRAHPHSIVISYQGDGDLAAIGTAEIIHAANRGEHITVIFVNNAIYGMTGGQMAPTTLVGQNTTTTPTGRNPLNEGHPIRVSELINALETPVFIERVSLHSPKHTARARRVIRRAIQAQAEGKGFSFVEVLSACPSGWKMDPVAAEKWIEEHMLPVFPLGNLRDRIDETPAWHPQPVEVTEDLLRTQLDLKSGEAHRAERSVPITEARNPELLVAGFGGQGIMLLGIAAAQAAMIEGYQTSWIPSYGPEMRGGTANCAVRIADEPIGSPLVSEPTILMAFNRPSLEKFAPRVKPGGLIFYDSSLIDVEPGRPDCLQIPVPFTQLADGMGNTRFANMIALGALCGYTNLLPEEALYEALPAVIKRRQFLGQNREAIAKGMEAGRQLRAISN